MDGFGFLHEFAHFVENGLLFVFTFRHTGLHPVGKKRELVGHSSIEGNQRRGAICR